MKKLFYSILGIVLILIGLSAFLWFSQPKPIDMAQPNHQTDEKERDSANDNLPQPSTILPETGEGETELIKKFKAYFAEEQLTDPEVQRVLKIIESPEGQAFFNSKTNGLADTLAFFESQGVKVNRNMFTERYRSVFPTEEPEEFEEEMRERLVEMMRTAEIEMGNREDLDRFTDLITEFLEDERNYAWVSGRFQGSNDAFGKWVVQVLRNPVAPPVEQKPETVVSESEFPFEMPPNAQDTTEIQAPTVPSTDTVELSPEAPASDGELPTTETELLELLTENPPEMEGENLTLQLPTEAQIEAALREQFNPERYQKAMSTLNRYGPEEGLRRLKSADPEIAKQIEPLLKRKENTQ
ncbi:hypothetical protein F4Y93_06495 [Candidatus Poribacteria bacterium]|nr:hypothetical protein [Candidatus Poribacteria bacterium]